MTGDSFKRIQASGSRGDRHARRYFNDLAIKTTKYQFVTKYGPFESGYITEVFNLQKIDDKYHVGVFDYSNPACPLYSVPISKFAAPFKGKNPEAAEDFQIDSVHQQIMDHLDRFHTVCVDIHLSDGRVIKDVIGAFKVGNSGEKKKPKADMVFRDVTGKDVYFASLKKSPDPKRFQQYGGLTHETDCDAVKSFSLRISSVLTEWGNRLHKAVEMVLDHANPEHRRLQKQAMFGILADSEHDFGVHNVNDIMCGNITLTSDNFKSMHLTAEKCITNDSNFNFEEHRVVLGASHREDGRNFFGNKNVRVGIYPHGWRSNVYQLD